MTRRTPLTAIELEVIAAASEAAVHEIHEHAERAHRSIGTLEPTLDQILAIQRHAQAMLSLADALLTHKQMNELRRLAAPPVHVPIKVASDA